MSTVDSTEQSGYVRLVCSYAQSASAGLTERAATQPAAGFKY